MPLDIDIVPQSDMYHITLEYDSGLYTEEDMLVLAGGLRSFVESITKNSVQQKISSIPVLSDFESQELISLGNGGEICYTLTETFVDLFNKQVQLNPEKIAVVDEGGSITYSELDRMSDSLASVLVSKGVGTDQFVALMLPRCKEFIVCFLAVFKAGGAYIPLDSDYPHDRLLHMLQDSKAKILLTTNSLFTEKQKSGDFSVENILYVDDFDFHNWEGHVNYSQPSSLAYMIYTSGSTGQPKGVMIEHKSLRSFVSWFSDCIELNSDDRCAQHASFSFDASMDDLMTPLSVGAEIHILSSVLRHDMQGMYNYFIDHHITGSSLSTQLGMEMLNEYELPLRFIVVGGEKLKSSKLSSTKVINTYGPTEFTVSATYHILDSQRSYANIPIGRPVPNSISVIVDKSGNLVPRGIAGELCLIGRQISRGYWGRPELTMEKFVSCGFMNGEKMYRTGDLARWNTEGELEYLGRIDNQVKLRGFRIELGEIETAILCHEGIQDAIVEVKEIGGVQHLCAYYTSHDTIEKDHLREYLSESLTDYMIPTAFMHLESFPLTPNGKINRKALPLPELERNVKYQAPTNKIEEDLCSIFENLLKLDQVGIQDNFFEIGGTSIIAIKAIIQITNLGYQLNYGDLFKLKTPYSIAQFLDPDIKVGEDNKEDSRFDFSTYNYNGIDNILAKNEYDLWNNFDLRSLGKVMLTGATGYLGIHLLHHLLMNDHHEIYCLVRSRSKITPESRIKALMTYYFSDEWEVHFDSRVKVIEGDITDDDLIEKLKGEKIDTIFNCAAMVKHYVAENTMEIVNVDGVSALISLSIEKEAYLIHISTYSIGGTVRNGEQKILSEQDFYIGQVTDNEYVRTKFVAERIILEAIANRGLKAKIMRVGNLMGRASDGEFQINFNSNAFVSSLKSYKILGVFPLDEMTNSIEISPIDKTAEALIKLAGTPQDMVIFHPYNNYQIDMAVIVKSFNDYGYKIDVTVNSD
ncbi:Tyrocidine synthase 1 [Chryseobacterium fistulae]|uniref:Tyrocidine synthase 1 n=1 Tax=Chryseobacterium fistulae TaxID=2675058 RepID=A0A6N4XTI2_9FLAO|nr:Tyrocidine synthase 1 [Chryseobacterium fistulae]